MPKPTASRAPGFTLIEVLIASLLTGTVVALALKGFSEVKRIADLSSSRSVAQTEAASGMSKIVDIMRKAQIVFYTGRPMKPTAVVPSPVVPLSNVLHGVVPPTLATVASGSRAITCVASLDVPNAPVSAGTFTLGQFRFSQPGGGGFLDSTVAGNVLTSLNPDDGAAPGNKFPSPLAYVAVATYSQKDLTGPADEAFQNVPLGWTFYVFYLAPMQLKQGNLDALAPVMSAAATDFSIRDQGTSGGVRWNRSVVPFDLHLMTIGHVPASTVSTVWPPPDTDLPLSRTFDGNSLLPAPFDFKAGVVNYDPVPIRMETGNLNLMLGSVNPYPTGNSNAGVRVNGVAMHLNDNNIANDPPSTGALAAAIPDAVTTVNDQVVAHYIDPDAANGTYIRFVNTQNLKAAGGTVKRLLNAYEPLELVDNNDAEPPTRMVIGITTRFRNNRTVPFQFATETHEVELEGVTSYYKSALARFKR